MAKPYSQDLRDRVIEAVERGKMSAERRVVITTRSANPWPSSGWSALSAKVARACRTWRPSCFRAHAAPDFLKGRAPRTNRTSRFRLCAIACRPSAGSKPTPR